MGRGRTGSLESLRERNRLRVIDVLRRRGVASRAEIARRTGLSRSTVSSIVADLQATGLVVERAEATEQAYGAQGGRPPVLLAFDQSAGAVLGVNFGHGAVRVAVADLSVTVLAEAWEEIEHDHAATVGLDLAEQLVERVLSEAGVGRDRVVAAGMAVSAPIRQPSGTVGSSSILPGWAGVNAAGEMAARLGMPVHVDNDANLGALAEMTLGAGRDVADFAYLLLGSGIGAGLVFDGHLYRGAGGTAGEIGHVVVDEDGDLCRCGNRGCLETFAATPALLELVRRSRGEAITTAEMIALALAGDAGCRRVIDDAGRFVGRAVADLCNQFNPRLVIAGGELAAAGDLLLHPVRESLQRYAIAPAVETVRVIPGVLGERTEVLGALVLAVGESESVLATRLTAGMAG